MSEEEIIKYFNDNLSTIFSSNTAKNIEFINTYLEDPRVKDLIKEWPDEIKIKVVQKHLLEQEIDNFFDSNEYSWSEYYEMYDGKFDEQELLSIIIDKKYLQELSNLGYQLKENKEKDQQLEIGEFIHDNNGNLVIYHSCPDREIFSGELEQHLEELSLKFEWVIRISLSRMI